MNCVPNAASSLVPQVVKPRSGKRSREKGKRGERQWRDELRAQGFAARRGQQFSGSADSPDVVCEQLNWIHFEVKAVERLNVQEVMEQARRDAGDKISVVAHKRNFREWLITITAEVFFKFLRGDFTAEGAKNAEPPDVSLRLEPKILGRPQTAFPPTTTTNKKKEANEDKE
jgi:hypothetical protein